MPGFFPLFIQRKREDHGDPFPAILAAVAAATGSYHPPAVVTAPPEPPPVSAPLPPSTTAEVPEAYPGEIEAYIRQAAAARGINGDIAVKVANGEGGVRYYNRRGTFATGSSWWPYQLHYGGKGYERFGTVAGMGTGFTAATGYQPGDAAAWKASVDYALDVAKANGWGPPGGWYGAHSQGITGFMGISR